MDAAEVEERLQNLHRERGRLLLDGKSTDKVNAAIVALHVEQSALLDLENAKQAQSREAAAKAYDSEVGKLDHDIAHHADFSVKALAEAEASLRKAVAAMKLHHNHEAQKRKAIGRRNTLTGAKESALSEFELYRRGSRLWLAQLNTLTSAPGQYGDLRFPSLHLPPSDKSWT